MSQDIFISVLKVLWVQGDPFQPGIVKAKYCRITVGLFLLMGIVLSNAYKNTNVYNMVVQRQPILYKYFKDMVHDRLEIYTRSLRIRYINPEGCLNHSMEFLGECFHIVRVMAFTTGTEVESIVIGYLVSLHISNTKIKTDPTLIDNGLNYEARVHPEVLSTFIKVLLSRIKSDDFDEGILLEGGDIHDVIPTPLQTEIIRKTLGNCHNTATILPNFVSMEMYQSLVKDKLVYAFIGEELFSEVDWLFWIDGIEPNLIQRIHRIGESGIYQWWVDVFQGKGLIYKSLHPVKVPTMEGNIITIFAIWLVGIGIAILYALVEQVLDRVTLALVQVCFEKLARSICHNFVVLLNILRELIDMKSMAFIEYCS